MWNVVANEMGIPLGAAEDMRWQIGEKDMAKRAVDIPFSQSSSVVLESHRNTGSKHDGTGVEADEGTGVNEEQ